MGDCTSGRRNGRYHCYIMGAWLCCNHTRSHITRDPYPNGDDGAERDGRFTNSYKPPNIYGHVYAHGRFPHTYTNSNKHPTTSRYPHPHAYRHAIPNSNRYMGNGSDC
ncbi:MAG: hypothetical protein GY938_16845 [Ketobacter sp.]|nr:hypothetical protein [Ketobacter sp.]